MVDTLVKVTSTYAFGAYCNLNFGADPPLDSTHLLVAVLNWSNPTVNTAVFSGGTWTKVVTAATSTHTQDVWVRQADGTVNGVIFNGTSNEKNGYLMAFSGWVSDTPMSIDGATDSADTGLSHSLSIASPAVGYGIAIALLGHENTIATPSWSNGYTATGTDPGGDRFKVARKEYTGHLGSYGTTFAHTTSAGSSRKNIIVMPLVGTPTTPGTSTKSIALGSVPVTAALGSTPVEGWLGAGG